MTTRGNVKLDLAKVMDNKRYSSIDSGGNNTARNPKRGSRAIGFHTSRNQLLNSEEPTLIKSTFKKS